MTDANDIVYEVLELRDVEYDRKYRISIGKQEAQLALENLVYANTLLEFCRNNLNNPEYAIECMDLNCPSEEPQASLNSHNRSDNGNDDDDDNDDEDDNSTSSDNTAPGVQREGKMIWKSQDVMLLIATVKKIKSKFPEQKNKKAMSPKFWNKVVAKMNKKGYNLTSQQCRSKWSSLLDKYKRVRGHNSQSGNDPEHWEFFELMDEVERARTYIMPLATASSTESEVIQASTSVENSSSGKRKRQSDFEFAVHVLEKNHQERMESIQERNKLLKESNDIMAQYLNIIKKNSE